MADEALPLPRMNAILRELSEELVRLAAESCKPKKKWTRVFLDVRYWPEGDANMKKVRVVPVKGESVGPEATAAIERGVDQLWQLRAETGTGNWFGFVLTVTNVGDCKVEYNYDQGCAEDESFYDD